MLRRACQCIKEFCSFRNETKMFTNESIWKETEKQIHPYMTVNRSHIYVNNFRVRNCGWFLKGKIITAQ